MFCAEERRRGSGDRLTWQTMESMALIPQAARTLVYKYNMTTWCTMHYELSVVAGAGGGGGGGARASGAAAEERERLVRLVELCVRGCVAGEARKGDDHGTEEVNMDGDGDVGMEMDRNESGDGEVNVNEEKNGQVSSALFDSLRPQKPRKDWVVSVEVFLQRVVRHAGESSRISLTRASLSLYGMRDRADTLKTLPV